MHHCSRHCDTMLPHEMLSYPSRNLKTREDRNKEITSFSVAWYMRKGRGAQELMEAREEAHQLGRLLHGTNCDTSVGWNLRDKSESLRLREWITPWYSTPPRWHPVIPASWYLCPYMWTGPSDFLLTDRILQTWLNATLRLVDREDVATFLCSLASWFWAKPVNIIWIGLCLSW